MTMDKSFHPRFTITNRMTATGTWIERAQDFLEVARLSLDWVREMGNRALVPETHHTTHIEGTLKADFLHGQVRDAWKMVPAWVYPVQGAREGI